MQLKENEYCRIESPDKLCDLFKACMHLNIGFIEDPMNKCIYYKIYPEDKNRRLCSGKYIQGFEISPFTNLFYDLVEIPFEEFLLKLKGEFKEEKSDKQKIEEIKESLDIISLRRHYEIFHDCPFPHAHFVAFAEGVKNIIEK